jgi:hypothetical protein
MSKKTISVPTEVLKKIASFVSQVPSVIAGLDSSEESETKSAACKKQASECVSGLIQYAGLVEEKRAAFEEFVATPEGAMQTISSLTNKIAALNEELESAKQLSLGAPSKRASSNKTASDSSRVWCETLLG